MKNSVNWFEIPVKNFDRAKAVSYTHLDVYKRQTLCWRYFQNQRHLAFFLSKFPAQSAELC